MEPDENSETASEKTADAQIVTDESPAELRGRAQGDDEFEHQMEVARRIMRDRRAVLEALAK